MFLTLFFSLAELPRSAPSLESNNNPNEPTTSSRILKSRWQGTFNQLVQYLSSGALDGQLATDPLEMNHTQKRPGTPFGEDEPVWPLALAVSTDFDDQPTVVGGSRGNVLKNVIIDSTKIGASSERALKIIGLS
ncbi:hypothetical protein KEM48_003266 [Puccinia striiformis f. sp. tritici PST-130]|nr:hypothetical protein KEM48_003266 [Puccinia striiformis f. sp. tritici PST-130]